MIDAWLEAEVELLQRFDSWQTSLFQPGFHSALMSAVLFLLQRHAQECRLIFGLTEALVVKTCIFMLLTRTKGERNRKQH